MNTPKTEAERRTLGFLICVLFQGVWMGLVALIAGWAAFRVTSSIPIGLAVMFVVFVLQARATGEDHDDA